MITQAVILAGGLGTRLRPITETIPKSLVEVSGKPFLHWQLMSLKEAGFKRVLILTGYLGDQIQNYFGGGEKIDMQLSYSQEVKPLGTGGALNLALPLLDNEFVLLNGDSFLKAPYKKMVDDFKRRNLLASISAFGHRSLSPVVPNLKIGEGYILEYKKNGGSEAGFQYIDSGVYVMSKAAMVNNEEVYSLESLWPKLIATRKLGGFFVEQNFFDIGTPERLRIFEEKIGDYFPNPLSN